MSVRTVDIIAGARPNFMKVAPIVRAFDAARSRGGRCRYRLVHTGQHYDAAMSDSFFEQLGLPEPDVHLRVGPGSHAEQTAAIMVGYERELLADLPDACLVVGDVTSTMACAIVARKMGIRVGHVEGGLRSHDWRMPEEVNRVVADAVSNWFFTTSRSAGENLRDGGVGEDRVFFVGNTMIDTLLAQRPFFQPPPCWTQIPLAPRRYVVVTLHRPANVDRTEQLSELVESIGTSTGGLPAVFPVHPRTARTLRSLRPDTPNLHYIDPLGYRQFNYLVEHAKAVITDSGGVTEEATVLGVPCLTVRENTERPETVTIGTNELVGTDPANLRAALARVVDGRWKTGAVPELWDGHAGERIVAHLERLLA